MDHPWGLSGSEFLALYGAALLGLLLLAVAVALLTKSGSGGNDEEMEAYELAYLFGGVDRVADTAVAGLVETGSVRVTRSRELHSTRTTGADQYQNKVLEWSWRDINRVRRAFRVVDLGEPLREALQRRGLVMSDSRRRASELVAWLFPLLGLVGAIRLLNGVAHGYPVGFLVLELIVTALLWAGARVAGKNPRPTWAGERMKRARKERERERPPAHRSPGGVAEPATAMGLVAIGGVSAYPDSELSSLLTPPTSSGSGGGSGGGGGCGGGGG